MLDDAWRAVAELAASQHGAFTRAQAAARGVDHRRISTALRQGRIDARGPDVFVIAGHPTSYHQRVRVATLLGAGAVASHRAAAALLGFDGFEPRSRSAVVEVSVPANRWLRIPDGLAVVTHQVASLGGPDVVHVDGIPCTGKARTLADLGSVVAADEVLRALIGLRRNGTSPRWLGDTARRLHRPGQRGTGVLLRHLDELRRAGVVPESWLEEVLRRIITHPSLPSLVSQYRLQDERGRTIARFDHAFPDVRLAIEGHSRRFHFGPVNESVDEDRDLRVARRGWEVLYLGWYAKRRPADVVEAIVDVVAHRRRLSAAS